MKNWFLGLVAATVAAPLQAAIITEQYDFTLPAASGNYSAGHTFQVTVTYDNAGTFMNTWNDGPNSIAQFGAQDDTLYSTTTTAVYTGYTFMSNATIVIDGLLLPVGATPHDEFARNFSRVAEDGDVSTTGRFDIQVQQDDILLEISIYGPQDHYYDQLGHTYFRLEQWMNIPNHTGAVSYTPFRITEPVIPTDVSQVSEPSALALLGLGLTGIGLVRRRNRQESTV